MNTQGFIMAADQAYFVACSLFVLLNNVLDI